MPTRRSAVSASRSSVPTYAPSRSTDRWSGWRNALDPDAVAQAFEDVALIEAANEREEATAIAIALRLALEEPGRHGESQAALITPDRALARRVAAELARFGITADDSAGTPLSATPQGTLLQLMLEATLRPGDPVAVAPAGGEPEHAIAALLASEEGAELARRFVLIPNGRWRRQILELVRALTLEAELELDAPAAE